MSILLEALIIGGVIGLSLGMLGGGGSILTVPALVYILGESTQGAIGTSLIIVGLNSLLGVWLHLRQDEVLFKPALLFSLGGFSTAFLGARLEHFVSPAVLLISFALLMISIAILMLSGYNRPKGSVQSKESISWLKMLIAGSGVGFLTGFLGVGGGFLVVPALVLLLGLKIPQAIGTSLLIIAFNSFAGLLGHLGSGGIDWSLVGLLTIGGVLGSLLGSKLGHRLPIKRLNQAFAVFVLLLGFTLLGINLPPVLNI